MRKRIAAIFAALLLVPTSVHALTDDYVLNDAVQTVYQGRAESSTILTNIRFTDVSQSHWASEAIARTGAVGLVKGYDRRFNPSGNVTIEEGLAFVLRGLGYEREALTLGLSYQAENENVRTVWSIGYLQIASRLGMISPADFASVLSSSTNQSQTAPTFSRTAAASREQIAFWIYTGLMSADPAVFDIAAPIQSVFNFADWTSIAPRYLEAMEAIVANKIMSGSSNRLRPQSAITRAEMAQVLKNIEYIYLPLFNMETRSGTVGALRDGQYTSTNAAAVWRNIFVRTQDGSMDVLQYSASVLPNASTVDAIVWKNGALGGMATLAEGDVIEYIVAKNTNTVLYVKVIETPAQAAEVTGMLYQIDANERTIALRDTQGKVYKYSLVDYLLQTLGGVTSIQFERSKWYDIAKLPYGSSVRLKLKAGVVTEIEYVGEPLAIAEIRGIVTENNVQFGYLTIIDNNGRTVTKSYYEDDLFVEKQQSYDVEDEIGYIDQVFPHFEYDPRDAHISAIEPGDIVFIRTAPGDSSRIVAISASTNYIMKYGKVRQLNQNGALMSMLVEYEDKQTAWFDVAPGVFVSRAGKPIQLSAIQVGDWVKLLVNEAILAPGYVTESVKEITVEGAEHFIGTILKGNLAGIDSVQKMMILESVQTLDKTGWTGYRDLQPVSIAANDVEYYYQGTRVSLDYVAHYLKNSGVQAYVALENNYAGARVRKVTFRLDREEVLPADTVISADGTGQFGILGHNYLFADEGTIVRRHGRLVTGQDILVPDYVMVVVNGTGTAAVVDIVDAPDTSKIMVARGRVISVNEGQSFKVQSMSVLAGTSWVYTPVQREFTIDNKTLFLNEEGYVDPSTFMGYTDESVINTVYNIVVDGSRAAYVVEAPYATAAVRGTIYNKDGDTLYLRNASVLNTRTGQWAPVSNVNSIIEVNVAPNTIIGMDNAIVQAAALRVGDQLCVMAAALPATAPGMVVDGTIIMVEK